MALPRKCTRRPGLPSAVATKPTHSALAMEPVLSPVAMKPSGLFPGSKPPCAHPRAKCFGSSMVLACLPYLGPPALPHRKKPAWTASPPEYAMPLPDSAWPPRSNFVQGRADGGALGQLPAQAGRSSRPRACSTSILPRVPDRTRQLAAGRLLRGLGLDCRGCPPTGLAFCPRPEMKWDANVCARCGYAIARRRAKMWGGARQGIGTPKARWAKAA